MENRKPPTEDEARVWLQNGQLALPPLRFSLLEARVKLPGRQEWDFNVEASWEDQSALFAVEYKSLFTPKAFEQALNKCRTAIPAEGIFPLLMMPFLRPAQLEELEELSVSGVDWCGNGVVIIPGKMRVYRTGNPNKFASYSPIKNIYRKNTSMVARVLFSESAFPSVQDILAEVNQRDLLATVTGKTPMTLGTVSKALKQLEDDMIVKRERGSEICLLQGDKLLDQLQQSYEPPTTKPIRLKVDCDFDQLPKLISQRVDQKNGPLVATGLSSLSRYATMQREEILSLYCNQATAVMGQLGGRETERFPNLELIETVEQPLYFDARQDSGFYWASPVQTYLELMQGDKRDRETAEQVRDFILRELKGER